MAMIEALACGTPVLALSYGAAPEIIENGTTGFLAATAADLTDLVALVPSLDRAACRRAVEGHFSSARMAAEHVELYNRVLAASPLRRVESRS
jgi:glycosyltransferase involved in cell wall biosynthesis